MANKIQVRTVEMNANVEVIPMNAYLVAKCVRTHAYIKNFLERNESEAQRYNKDTQTWEKVLDENGKQVYDYGSMKGKELKEHILPLLDEFVAAFGV